jgi:hypothetical protein
MLTTNDFNFNQITFLSASFPRNIYFCAAPSRLKPGEAVAVQLSFKILYTIFIAGCPGKAMKKLLFSIIIAAIAIAIFIWVKRSIPYDDSAEMFSTSISIDSIWSVGPAAAIYDRRMQKYFWLKSYSSFDMSSFETLKNKTARIRYMKFLAGPFENRIFRMEVDSVLVFDQVVERK